MEKNLLIYGAGNIGSKVGFLWKKIFPQAEIYAVTKSNSRHELLSQLGMKPLLSDQTLPVCPYVLCSVPPTEDYEILTSKALQCWDKSGRFIFTSSTSVFSEKTNGIVTENSPLDLSSRIRPSELLVDQAGGTIVRLAGLYDDFRGPHHHLKKTMKIRSSKNSFLNLIHTDDAASLCVQALQFAESHKYYLGCDNHPIKQIDFATLVLQDKVSAVEFAAQVDSGKQCDCTMTMKSLKWLPTKSKFHI